MMNVSVPVKLINDKEYLKGLKELGFFVALFVVVFFKKTSQSFKFAKYYYALMN